MFKHEVVALKPLMYLLNVAVTVSHCDRSCTYTDPDSDLANARSYHAAH